MKFRMPFTFLFTIAAFFYCLLNCKKKDNSVVSATSGAVFYTGPNISSATENRIPFLKGLNVIQVLEKSATRDGVEGKWVQIESGFGKGYILDIDTREAAEISKIKETAKKLYKNIEDDFQGYDDLKEISSIGHRMTGTENLKKAVALLAKKYKSWGYEPKYFSFKLKAWQRGRARLRIITPDGDFYPPVIGLGYIPEKSIIKKRVVDTGDGNAIDLSVQGRDIKDAIILANLYDYDPAAKGRQHRTSKISYAKKRKGAGVIFINKFSGNVLQTGTGSHSDQLIELPAVSISKNMGERIRGHTSKGLPVYAEIYVENTIDEKEMRNIYVDLPGSDPKLKGEYIYIGAHFDTWDLSEAAIDNGIGSATVFEMARIFKKLDLKPKRTIRFILWTGEEMGLLGSKNMVKAMVKSGEIEKVKYYINIDLAGNPKGFDLEGRDEMANYARGMISFIQELSPDFKGELKGGPSMHSDNMSFSLRGIPVLHMRSNLKGHVYKYYHSNRDSFDLVDKDHLHNSVKYMAIPAYLLANTDIPAKKLSDEDTRDFFIKHKMKFALMLSKDWRWKK